MTASTKSIGPLLGINNRLPDHRLDVVERGRPVGTYLRNAVNVDLTAAATAQRRPGTERVQAGTDCHSLWSDGKHAFYADGDTLYSYPRTTVRSGLTPGLRVSYCADPRGGVIWSNGTLIERIVAGVSQPLGPAVPNPAPVIGASSGGSLPAGAYLACVTAVGADGQESGTTWPVSLGVPEGGVVTFAGLPGSLVNIYLSPANGDVPFLVASTTASTYAVPVMPQVGQQCPTLHLRPMPAGHIVREHNGRLLVAAGSMLFYSEPFAPALYNPARGYIPFKSRIAVVEPCGGGVFVATLDETYYLAGDDIDKCEVRGVLPYGAVEGTGCEAINDETVWWFSTRGVVVGSPDGQVKNIQEENVSVERAEAGAAHVREQNGMRQMVAALFKPRGFSPASATSFMEMEVVRKENML